MTLHGQNFIGDILSADGTAKFTAFSTLTSSNLETEFYEATADEVDRTVKLAAAASGLYSSLPAEVRADFLIRIAEEIVVLGDVLIERAHVESALPEARLTGERGRTVNQLRMFADLVREGSYVDARIDQAPPERTPLPRPDLRRMLTPLGPVAVFGASNFPLAFSVAGGDTASALAAGCPVVVKAHPAHPGTSELVAGAILKAAKACYMPNGVFSMVHGGAEVGRGLVNHADLEAVAFTGSLGGGRALFDLAAARPRPIPVYAEMGSINPIFVLPGALQDKGPALAAGLAQSVTLGVGQFCTNPGLVVGMKSDAMDAFVISAASEMSQKPGAMLTLGICESFSRGKGRLSSLQGVTQVTPVVQNSDTSKNMAISALFATDAETFLQTEVLSEEVFGPLTLVVLCRTEEEMTRVAQHLEGQLTATVHANTDDIAAHRSLFSILEKKVGRLVFNGFPTGVEVSPAMQHGGPYPAATDSRSTSVGTAAIFRFLRPVCWQNAPQEILPPELKDANPRGIWRTIENQWTRESVQ